MAMQQHLRFTTHRGAPTGSADDGRSVPPTR